MSTRLILTFSIFEVGSSLDFVHSGFCPIPDFVQFGILSNSRFCPIRDFVQDLSILVPKDLINFVFL